MGRSEPHGGVEPGPRLAGISRRPGSASDRADLGLRRANQEKRQGSAGARKRAIFPGISVGVSLPSLGSETACSRSVERKKPGPPSKGPRVQLKARMPEQLYAAALQEAARRGMTLTDFVGELIAESTGVPYSFQEALKSA